MVHLLWQRLGDVESGLGYVLNVAELPLARDHIEHIFNLFFYLSICLDYLGFYALKEHQLDIFSLLGNLGFDATTVNNETAHF